jgi:hypothetical protein
MRVKVKVKVKVQIKCKVKIKVKVKVEIKVVLKGKVEIRVKFKIKVSAIVKDKAKVEICQLTCKSKSDPEPILGSRSRPDLLVSRLFCNSLKQSVSQRHDNYSVLLESVYQISY